MEIEPIEVPLHETAKKRYLNYAMSVITSRALPDVRDGLKPVQRRILYTMFKELRLTHDNKHRKSAAVVGEVMGKYHPHGDSAIYDAMVRMAQDFSLRYPLVDGQGNFGSIDGDNAAAMRYTEARMTALASELISEIKKETVNFRPTYDAENEEPIVLPSQVPNLLVNGATGIAVGMATNIPPHHLGETLDALIAMIDDKDLGVDGIVGKYVLGPDFPTGGVMLNDEESLREIYTTGSGAIELRSTWEIEKDGHKKSIIITSVPYATNKSSLIEKIASHIIGGKLPQIVDVRDESTDDVRVVLELKRGASAETAMAYLFKHTPLQARFHVNLTCLVPSTNPMIPAPAKLDLAQMLRHFLDFRLEVVTKRLEYDLRKLRERIHILEGFELVFSDLDAAIRIIRASASKREAAEGLMDYFGVDEAQADAVLETKLYRLARLEIDAIIKELNEKRAEAARIEALLASEDARWALIKEEFLAIRSAYSDPRRTGVDVEVKELEYEEEAYIIDEKCFVMVTKNGWYKRQKSYSELSSIRVREDDAIGWVLPGRTRKSVLFFTNKGRVYTMRIADVPSTTGYGDPLQATFDFEDGEKVVGVVTDDDRVLVPVEPDQTELVPRDPEDGDGEAQFVGISKQGQAIRFSIEGFVEPSTVKGRLYMRLSKGDEVLNVEPTAGDENVAIASRHGRGLMFAVREISFVKGVAKGVRAISLEKDDEVLDFTLCDAKRDGLEVETNRGARVIIRSTKSKFEPTSRANKGRWIIKRGYLTKSHRPPVEIRPSDDSDDVEEEFDEDVEDTIEVSREEE